MQLLELKILRRGGASTKPLADGTIRYHNFGATGAEVKKTVLDIAKQACVVVTSLTRESGSGLEYGYLITVDGEASAVEKFKKKLSADTKQRVKASKMNEDFGSSDWYGYLQDMQRLIDKGLSVDDAAKDVAASVHDHLGYDDMDDTIARVKTMYKARQKVKEETLTEGYDERVQAAVQHLIKKFEKTPSSKADLLSALHDYASKDTPDYKGSASARAEFVRDVLAGAKGRIARKTGGSTGPRYDPFSGKPVAKPKPDLDVLYQKGVDVIGNTFPDGDPIDTLGPWLKKQGFDFEDMNRAFRKHEKKDFYGYLAHMWDDHARDELHDAKNGHADENSQFYHKNDQGDWVLADNPWMTRHEQKLHRDKHEARDALQHKKHQRQMDATKVEKPEAVEEGVLGSDVREPAVYPDAKFDYANWKAGKPPVPGKKVAKPDPSRWNDLDKKEPSRLDAARARRAE